MSDDDLEPGVQYYRGRCPECAAQLGDPMSTQAQAQHEVDLHQQHNPQHNPEVKEYPFHD